MDDLFLFIAGLVVTLVVGAAVSLLLWGASQEPRARQRPAVGSDGEGLASPSQARPRFHIGS